MLPPEKQCWLGRDVHPSCTAPVAPFHFRKVYIIGRAFTSCWHFRCLSDRISYQWALSTLGQQVLSTMKELVWFEAFPSSLAWEGKEYFQKVCFCAAQVVRVLFWFRDDTYVVMIFVHMEDLVILIPELSGVKWAEHEWNNLFKLSDWEELKYYFGFSFNGIENTTLLGESAYCSCFLKHLAMEMSKNTSTPMVEKMKTFFLELVLSEEKQNEAKALPCWLLIWSLSNLRTHSRLDITFLAGILSRLLKVRQMVIWWLQNARFVVYNEPRNQ